MQSTEYPFQFLWNGVIPIPPPSAQFACHLSSFHTSEERFFVGKSNTQLQTERAQTKRCEAKSAETDSAVALHIDPGQVDVGT